MNTNPYSDNISPKNEKIQIFTKLKFKKTCYIYDR